MVRLLVGPNQREFTVHKKLLCASSTFFRYSLESLDSAQSTPGTERQAAPFNVPEDKVLWLSDECPDMIELFVFWLYQRSSFRALVEQMIESVAAQPRTADKDQAHRFQASRRALHWNFIRLHLFAAVTRIPALQDVAMDAVQDLYLRCDWDVSVTLARFLYRSCTREQAFRLRKWAVAMIAWSLSSGVGDPLAYDDLFADLPDLWADYDRHVDWASDSKVDRRVKNPQLRLPRNKLRSDERHFGYRQCSFHSHRSSVGEGRCPHDFRKAVRAPLLSPTQDTGFEDGSPRLLPAKVDVAPPEMCSYEPQHRPSGSGSVIWTVPESAEET